MVATTSRRPVTVGGYGVLERLLGGAISPEHLPNKFPEISPNFAGGNAICSRLSHGGEGSALRKSLGLLSVSGAAGQD
jgi:hypothetical protein